VVIVLSFTTIITLMVATFWVVVKVRRAALGLRAIRASRTSRASRIIRIIRAIRV